MRLSCKEIRAALSSTYFKRPWGSVKHGLCASAKVAELRGAKFRRSKKHPNQLRPDKKRDERIAERAFDDLCATVGWTSAEFLLNIKAKKRKWLVDKLAQALTYALKKKHEAKYRPIVVSDHDLS